MGRRTLFALAAAVVVIGLLAGSLIVRGNSSTVQLSMPSAAQLVAGSPVWIDGAKVGSVDVLEARDGRAVATLDLDHGVTLHEGTTARVEWKSVLGERVVALTPGPETNAEVPDGGLLEVPATQIEVDQVLAALDEPTREQLKGLFAQLANTMKGNEADLRQTLATAGPAVDALGQVLQAVGSDGPAIRALVSQLRELTTAVNERRDDLAATIGDLSTFTGRVAEQQEQLRAGLGELPSTLDQATATLGKVPGAAEQVVPLLDDLRPATAGLPGVAADLGPVLSDLRPAVADLRPALSALDQLLDYTPGLIDTAHQVLPPVRQAVDTLRPAVEFLRPYTPEFAGWLANWNSQYAAYDSQGHVWAGLIAPGPAGINESQVLLPPLKKPLEPPPGGAVNQPWTDANGSPIS
ncbi:MlaD family protein [Pseudonocardia sp. RS010]|uniref:MlaD family protein n=1 Tax=Pseudonocardia sp. RS010 TaxID=3385979 RepID=UPI0039A2DCFC